MSGFPFWPPVKGPRAFNEPGFGFRRRRLQRNEMRSRRLLHLRPRHLRRPVGIGRRRGHHDPARAEHLVLDAELGERGALRDANGAGLGLYSEAALANGITTDIADLALASVPF